jgi:hypothetical protein
MPLHEQGYAAMYVIVFGSIILLITTQKLSVANLEIFSR